MAVSPFGLTLTFYILGDYCVRLDYIFSLFLIFYKSSDNNNYDEFEHCYMHSLRHTFATRCIENGVQPKTLQKILGHSSINITMDLYVHVTDEQMFSEIEKMNKAI